MKALAVLVIFFSLIWAFFLYAPKATTQPGEADVRRRSSSSFVDYEERRRKRLKEIDDYYDAERRHTEQLRAYRRSHTLTQTHANDF